MGASLPCTPRSSPTYRAWSCCLGRYEVWPLDADLRQLKAGRAERAERAERTEPRLSSNGQGAHSHPSATRHAPSAPAAGALVHVDAVQAAGKLDLAAISADSLAISAHKLGGPAGAGALALDP